MVALPLDSMVIPDWTREIHFAFSRREAGQMSFKRASREVVLQNRMQFFASQRLDLKRVVAGELVHGGGVKIVGRLEAGRGATAPDWVEGVDGLVTADAGVLLLTTHADCAPVVIYDPVHRVIGQAHAGWRSLRSGIIENLVSAVRSFNGTGPNRLKAWIGPTVRACCYPVGSEVASQFPDECTLLIGDDRRLDLVRFIRLELARLGFEPEAVSDSGTCTCCNHEYSSFRRDGTSTLAMALVTGIR